MTTHVRCLAESQHMRPCALGYVHAGDHVTLDGAFRWKSEAPAEPSEEVQTLADLLHTLLCTYNHTDRCSWGYESGESYPHPLWTVYAHKRYADKAQRLLDRTTFDSARDVLTALVNDRGVA